MNHARTRRWVAGATITTLLVGVLSLVMLAPAEANHGDLTLEVYREFSSVPSSGGSITLTARVQNADGSPSTDVTMNQLEIDWEIEGIATDGEGGAKTYGAPDRSCRDATTPNLAAPYYECSITIASGGAVGTGFVRAWIDHDQNGPEIEADQLEGRLASVDSDCDTELPAPVGTHPSNNSDAYDECRSGTEQPGDAQKAEPDDTDLVQIAFTGASPVPRIDCPERTLAPAGETGFVACRVTDQNGSPLPGRYVDGERFANADAKAAPADYNGSNDTATECVSGADGVCKVRIPAPNSNTGDFQICFWVDLDHGNDNDAIVLNDPSYGADSGDGGQCSAEAVPETADDATNNADRVFVERQLRTRTSVDVEPENMTRTTGTAHTLTARILDQFGTEVPAVDTVRFEFLAGSIQDNDGSTPAVPDRTCSTSGTGDNPGTCTFTYSSSSPGTDTICGFIGTPSTTSCDGETQSTSTKQTADIVVQKWVAAAAATTTTSTTTQAGGGGGNNSGQGYSLVGGDGSLYAFGTAKNFGDMKGKALTKPIVGVAYTPGGNGYWLVAEDGGIFSFGNADFYGSMGDKKINSPVLGMAPTPSGKGYWLFAGDGGIFSFGDAADRFYGSMGDQKLNAPVINMEPLASGNGYWLVAADGGIFSFGKADFYGSMADAKPPLNQPVFDMTSTDTDKGYWLIARDGGVFSFGDAADKFYGNPVEDKNPKPTKIIGMDSTPSSLGYWIADTTGKVWNYGDAQPLGDRYGAANPAAMIGFASVPK